MTLSKLLNLNLLLDDGFRLTYLGYDFLAIKTMVNRMILMVPMKGKMKVDNRVFLQ